MNDELDHLQVEVKQVFSSVNTTTCHPFTLICIRCSLRRTIM